MAEPRRLDVPITNETADRDSRAEALLVEGLDRYFAGQYEDAIHLWTRVLFLDRSHARARAYIDRARTALAERQRRAEEMLHATGELLAQGQTVEARTLLTQAVAASADDAHAAELRLRLERLERARASHPSSPTPAVVDAKPIRVWQWWSFSRWSAGALVICAALIVGALAGPRVESWIGWTAEGPALGSDDGRPHFRVLTSSETALVRARTLYSKGRLAEALQALDRIDARSEEWAAADRLRVEIQQILLASRRGLSPSDAGLDRGRP